MELAEIERRYANIPPSGLAADLHEDIRTEAVIFTLLLDNALQGESREKSLVFTKLEEAMFWAHAHIARELT